MPRSITVAVVDDSAYIRRLLRDIINGQPDMRVVAECTDPYDARDKIKATNPDVVTLDIEMPRMDGISFLEKIMALRPMPVIMVSTLTQVGADLTLRALDMGAVDFIAKPQNPAALASLGKELVDKIRAAATARVRPHRSQGQATPPSPAPGAMVHRWRSGSLALIGASTGGVEALSSIIPELPAGFPPLFITQHMPEHFTASFAARLDKVSQISVREAVDGMAVCPGQAVIAPGGHHLEVTGRPGAWRCRVHDGAQVSGHRPSVDTLFSSAAKLGVPGHLLAAAILTGMGKDGALGMLELRRAGVRTIGQDPDTCVVYGMPKAAHDLGAVERQLPLNRIAQGLVDILAMEG